MDTPSIANYYREYDPLKRLEYLKQSMENGEEPEENAIRQEIWNIRYQDKADSRDDSRADGYLGLWMSMEFNKGGGRGFFGKKGMKKEIQKHLDKLKINEFQAKGGLHEELIYRECCHLVSTYISLCEADKNYNSTLLGIMPIKKDKARQKMQADVYSTAVDFPAEAGMEEELGIITRAAREIMDLHFSDR